MISDDGSGPETKRLLEPMQKEVSCPIVLVWQEDNGFPKRIKVDNGSEFISKILDKWAYENKVELDFSGPGRLTDKPFIESFNGSFGDEC